MKKDNSHFIPSTHATARPLSTRTRARTVYPLLKILQRTLAALLICLPGLPSLSEAQVITHSDPMRDYVRILPYADRHEAVYASFLLGPLTNEAIGSYTGLRIDHPWVDQVPFERVSRDPFGPDPLLHIYAPRFFMSHNSDFPAGGNDGALWQGRGTNMAASAGFRLHYGYLKLDVRPEFVYSANRDFERSPIDAAEDRPDGTHVSEFAAPLIHADLPQRFGTDPVQRLDPGASSIRLAANGWAIGISNAPIRTGPAIYNPLILSTSAPGFLHVFAGTEHPVTTGAGHFESRIFWGELRSSDYFMDQSTRRFTTGLMLTYAPSFLPGLQVGFNRVAYGSWPDTFRSPEMLFGAFKPRPEEPEEGEQPDDHFFAMHSFTARWALPETGFEAYAEWGRNDFRRPMRDFFLEPELNRGYVVGLLKRFTATPQDWIVLNLEMTQLENSNISALQRPNNVWYEHESIHGGFTHRGQNLGAPIGPGSSAQTAGLSWYNRFGMLGATAGRVVHHNDRLYNYRDFYESIQPSVWNTLRKLHEVEMRYRLEAMAFLPYGLELQAGLTFGAVENRYNVMERDETNTRFELTLRATRTGWLR